MQNLFMITGLVILPDGADCSGLRVQAFDRDLPSVERRKDYKPSQLGEDASTNTDGYFTITYTLEQFQRGEGISRAKKKNADISFNISRGGEALKVERIQLKDETGDAAAQGKAIIYNAPEKLEFIRIFVQAPPPPGDSEYEQLVALITPVIESLPLADLSDDDVDFLINEVDTDQKAQTQQHLQWLRRSAFLARQTQLPVEAFYGWGRENKPANIQDLVQRPLGGLSLVLSQLTALGEETLQAELRKASDEKIIPAAFKDGLALISAPIQAALAGLQDPQAAPPLPHFSGQLQDAQTGRRLADYTVQATLAVPQDHEGAADGIELGQVKTGPDGRFDIANARLGDVPGSADHGPRLRLVVTDPQGKQRMDSEMQVQINAEPLILWVPRLVDPPATLTRVDNLPAAGGPVIPASLAARLSQNEMLTLEDVRLKGGAAQLAGLPESELEAARLLDAHADLARLSPDFSANAALIDKGYDRSSKIADTRPDVFFADTREALGDAGAAGLHAAALAERKVLRNVLTDLRMGWDHKLAGRDEPGLPVQIPEPTRCSCKDCETAASPLAYLTDLLDYAVDHVTNQAKPITLAWLESTFHQPFGDLPIACESVDALLCQVRLCVEVLRQQLAGQALSPAVSDRLQAGEKAYRQAAYLGLLERLGTSYEALRLVDPKERKALAEQLGFTLEATQPDQLDALLLDPASFSEWDLERLFGLVDTRTSRDRLSDGLVLEDAQKQITRWDLRGIEWRRNTDDEGLIHVVIRKPAGGAVQVELYRSADRSAPALVAAGARSDAAGPVMLAQKNDSGLTGRLVIQYSADNATIALAAVPRLLAWRLKKLRSVWEEQDGASGSSHKPQPSIDPDLIHLSDLRDALAGPAADLWQARRKAVDQLIQNLQAARQPGATPADDLKAKLLVANWLGKTTADLVQLANDQTGGEDIRPQLAGLYLTQAAFDVLARVAHLVSATPPKTVLDSEWADVDAILAQVYKGSLADTWRAEEAAQHITLSPDFFLPPKQPPLQFPPVEPDPLPQWLASDRARHDWEQMLKTRVEQQQTLIAGLQQVVTDTEEASLISLRDALITATGVSSDPAAAAKLLTDRLLIDCANGACQKTTRIAQAIETIQGLLFSIYTDQLRDTYPDLSLAAEDFEREWTWVGSYAAWRSAMLVFIFPENIGHPSLRDRQSPGFKRLVRDIRLLPAVTPEKACQLAKSYAAYFNEVSQLSIEASARAVTRVYRGTGCRDRNPLIDRSVLHLFGRSPIGSTVYWSMFDQGDDSNPDPNPDPQSFWDWVPGLEAESVQQIIGATSYQLVNGTRFLYVFVKATRQGSYVLLFSRYNLETGAWESGATALDLPQRGQDFDAILLSQGENHPPRLALRLPPGGPGSVTYLRSLNLDGNSWADGDWFPQLFSPWRRIGGLKAQPGTKVEAVAPLHERLDIFTVGADGGVYHALWSPTVNLGDWSAWERSDPLFNVSAGSPLTGYAALGCYLEVYVVGPDGRLWLQSATLAPDGTNWSGWRQFADPAVLAQFTPITLADPGFPDTFLVTLTPDGTFIGSQRTASGVFGPWQQIGDPINYRFTLPGPVGGVPNIFFAIGNNGKVFWTVPVEYLHDGEHAFYSQWWSEVGDLVTTLGSPVSAVTSNAKLIDIYVTGSDGSINRFWFDLYNPANPYAGFNAASRWLRVGGLSVPRSTNISALARWESHRDLFVVGKDGRVYQTWGNGYGDGIEWNEWFPISAPGETFPARAPITAIERRHDHIDLFVVGNDGGIYTAWWDADPDAQWPQKPHVELPNVAYMPYVVGMDPFSLHMAAMLGKEAPGTLHLTEQMSAEDLQARRVEIRQAYLDNLPGSAIPPNLPYNQRRNVDYLDEAYYFVPMLLGLFLQRDRHYPTALDWYRTVYDYSMPLAKREIAYLLALNKDWKKAYDRAKDWLLDPLNPHRIMETRPRAYARYTILTIARCFLEAGDDEYTQDTNETVPRARTYYMTAMELLDTPDLHRHPDSCDVLAGEIQLEIGGHTEKVWKRYQQRLIDLDSRGAIEEALPKLQALQAEGGAPQQKLLKAHAIVQAAETQAAAAETLAPHATLAGLLGEAKTLQSQAYSALLSVPEVEQSARQAALFAGSQVLAGAAAAANLSVSALREQRPAQPWLGGVREVVPPPLHPGQNGDGNGHERLAEAPWYPFDQVAKAEEVYVPGLSYAFCAPSNPVLDSLCLHAEMNLYKLRSCRNISGMQRQLDPYTAPTDAASGLPSVSANGQLVLPGLSGLRPTAYHYSTLIERAKQLAQMAAQFEGSMLSAIEKRDAEAYTALKARQDTELMRSQVRLQDLRVTESEGGVRLAELQLDKAQISLDHWSGLLQEGVSSLEQTGIDALRIAAGLYSRAAFSNFAAAGTPSFKTILSFGSDNQTALAQAWSSLGQVASVSSQIMGLQATYERRYQEWQYNRQLARADLNIASQSVTIANDHLAVTREEREIASLQADHAAAVVEFLSNKFTNTELYDWMSNIYEAVYSWFLQQATAMAQVAATQLGFERQEVPPPFIQADYWEPPADNSSGQPANRRGLTGSARLLQDIQQLDQHAFLKNTRKLHLTKTISMGLTAPLEMQRFRQTGVLPFVTSMEMFDRDFPGHYLRLIKSVRATIVALVPPVLGIRATLVCNGTSHAVVGGGDGPLQKVTVRRDPQRVALSSALNDSGVFELDPQPELLMPFEGLGVETYWELHMPPASNPIDYNSIADVLVTIQYTALYSADYEVQVMREISRNATYERSISFSRDLYDVWCDLHSPDQSSNPPMTVTFKTTRADFLPNLTNLRIKYLTLSFAFAAGAEQAIQINELSLGSHVAAPLGATVKSMLTSRPDLPGYSSQLALNLTGMEPIGDWKLVLPDNTTMRRLFSEDQITDLQLVITYEGETPG